MANTLIFPWVFGGSWVIFRYLRWSLGPLEKLTVRFRPPKRMTKMMIAMMKKRLQRRMKTMRMRWTFTGVWWVGVFGIASGWPRPQWQRSYAIIWAMKFKILCWCEGDEFLLLFVFFLMRMCYGTGYLSFFLCRGSSVYRWYFGITYKHTKKYPVGNNKTKRMAYCKNRWHSISSLCDEATLLHHDKAVWPRYRFK